MVHAVGGKDSGSVSVSVYAVAAISAFFGVEASVLFESAENKVFNFMLKR